MDETVYEAIAACYASVLPDDRREGVALIDIGQHSTELVCYYGESGAAGDFSEDLRRSFFARSGACAADSD